MTIRLNPSNLGQTRSDLGLGTAATVNTGTTNATIPLLNANGRLDTARLGSGTASSSTFLRGDGSFAAAGGGNLELIASLTANNSADLTFTGLTTHRAYLFIGTEIVPATSQNDAITLFDTSGTLKTPYDGFVFGANTAGAALTRTTKSSVSAMTVQNINAMAKKVPGVNTGYNYSFILIRDTDSAGGNAIFGNYSFHSASAGMHSGFFAYRSQPTYSLGSLKYAVASGNITSGRMTCYGYKES
tara:strand:- start:440 stop:1171 length:732 start_codon:yes stop_codon:yes gene_type:complete